METTTTYAFEAEAVPQALLRLYAEAKTAIEAQDYPVGEIVRIESAGDAPDGQECVLFITTGGVAMRALMHRFRPVLTDWQGKTSEGAETTNYTFTEGW